MELKALPEAVFKAAQSPAPAGDGLALEEANRLLQNRRLPLETGFTRLSNGILYVAVQTQMPGVSSPMVDWWFGWHGYESRRYRLWHPLSHRKATMKYRPAPGASDRERYVGNTSFVEEAIGAKLQKLSISFLPPGNLLDESGFAAAEVGTAVAGRVGFQNLPVSFGWLLHLVQESPNGCEMRSRFWLGDIGLALPAPGRGLARLLNTRPMRKLLVPDRTGRDMVLHCAEEMGNLARILPDLYAKEKERS